MWMFDLLPYILLSWHMAFLTRSWCIPVAIYALFQFCVIRPIGYGWVTDLQGDIFYSITFMVFALIGRAMACATKTRGVVTRFVSPLGITESTGGWIEGWAHYFMRVYFKVVLILAIPMVAATLPYELIPGDLQWLGFALTLLLLCAIDVFFFLMFHPVKMPPKDGFIDMWGNDVTYSTRPVGRLTMLILFLVFDVVVTVVWCVVEKTTLWEQFYLAACLAGAFVIELIVVVIVYWGVNQDKLPLKFHKEKMGTEWVETDMPIGRKHN